MNDAGFNPESGTSATRALHTFFTSVSRPDGDLGAFFDNLAAAFDACDGETTSDGIVFRYLPVDFPDLGDQTFAVGAEIVWVRPGSAIIAFTRIRDVMIVAYIAAPNFQPDAGLLEDMVRIMVDRAG